MSNKSSVISILLVLTITSSCNLTRYNIKKSIVKNKSTKTEQLKRFINALSSEERKKWYIKTYSDLAVDQMKKYKIPASITLAQGLLESGAGASTLAINANNHFGIKCHQDWKGKKIFHDDDEKNECFRKYKNPLQSYIDHSEFLTTRGRYSFLFRYSMKNYIQWSYGLKKAGYATDPRYAEKLIVIIKKYDLWRFDGSKKPLKEGKKKNNKSENNQYVVKKGDTLYSISKKYKVSIDELIKKNNLKSNNLTIGQKLKI